MQKGYRPFVYYGLIFFLALDIGSTNYLVTEYMYVNEKVMEMEVKATYEVEYERRKDGDG